MYSQDDRMLLKILLILLMQVGAILETMILYMVKKIKISSYNSNSIKH